MMRAVRAFLSLVWRLACILGGWLMTGLARLFLGVAQALGWIGRAFKAAADWLFTRANRIRAASLMERM